MKTTSVIAATGRYLYIKVPNDEVPLGTTYSTFLYFDGTAWAAGQCSVVSLGGGDNQIRLERIDDSNWRATTDNSHVSGRIIFPIA